jgi:diguanylate cyclase (GGDEF)-like protein
MNPPYGVGFRRVRGRRCAYSSTSIETVISAADYHSRLKRDVEALHHGAFTVALTGAVAASTGLVGLPVLTVFVFCGLVLHGFAWRAEVRERRQIGRAGVVFGSMAAGQQASSVDGLLADLLGTARDLLMADTGWIALLASTPTGVPIVVTLAGGRVRAATVRHVTPDERALSALASTESGPVLVHASRAETEVRGVLARLEMRSALVSTFGVDGDVRGVIALGRAAGPKRFGSDDLHLLDAFAEHLGVLLENQRLGRSLEELTDLKEQLRHQASHDALTGLPNRVLFAERVAGDLEHAVAGKTAVLFLDLDDFKTINDSLGHQAGDELLVAASERIAACVRETDLAARLGGDEFAVLARVREPDEAMELASRLVATLEAPFFVGGRELAVHASVGIALAEPGGATADELLRNADVAMYEAKRGGKRRFASYESHMHTLAQRRQQLATALDRAVANDEIDVHYQPIVELESGLVVGVEALARWRKPNAELVYPAAFLPLAEEIGLMVDIGRRVLSEAVCNTSSWRTSFAGHEALRVCVNLTPGELLQPDLVPEIAETLDRHGLDPDSLVLELTESGVMTSPDAARAVMKELRSLGVSLAVDDFGTGHSSLAHLREFPIDLLKIAREFIAGLPQGHVDRVFVETIVRMGNALGLEVVAEGIESREQADAAAELGCRLGQGYWFGAPVGVFGATQYLAAKRLPTVLIRPYAGAA